MRPFCMPVGRFEKGKNLCYTEKMQEVGDLPQKKEDLRVQKTKKNIKETFLTLLEEKPLNKLHVQEILDRAQINRATFYKYYLDKYDLAEQMVRECMDTLMRMAEKRFDKEMNLSEIQMIILDIYGYIKANRRMVLVLWKSEGNSVHLYRDMEDLLRHLCLERLQEEGEDAPELQDYFATIYATLVLTTIKWHIERDRELDLQRMFRYVGLATQRVLL